MPDESTLATAAIDIESTVAVSLIADAVKLNQVSCPRYMFQFNVAHLLS